MVSAVPQLFGADGFAGECPPGIPDVGDYKRYNQGDIGHGFQGEMGRGSVVNRQRRLQVGGRGIE